MKLPKSRLDLAVVERGLAPTRAKAQALIMARRILINGEFADKPGTSVTVEDTLAISELEHPYVGRGGLKLAHAIGQFGIDLSGKFCLDIGASTGGFTDVMLRAGAAKVYAVDVGYGQLDQKLREDPRVEVREKVNARYLQRSDFESPPDFIAIDVSFISLRLILPPAAGILASQGEIVALIKPQFEMQKRDIGKGGIVRDVAKRQAAVDGVVEATSEIGLRVLAVIESPITGAEGNVEFLMHCSA